MTYYYFDSRTFRDRKVREVLKRHEHKWLWAALLAGEERTRLPGLLKLRITSLADEVQLSVGDTQDGLALMEQAGMIVIDRDSDLLQVPNAPKHNSCPNANVLRAWYAIWEELPHCDLRYEHIRLLVRSVNLQTVSLDQAWQGTFGTVLRAWDGRDPEIRYLAKNLRSRWVRHQPPGAAEPPGQGNGYMGNGYRSNSSPPNGSGGNGSEVTVTEVTVPPLDRDRVNGSGSGSGSGRDGYQGNRNVQVRDTGNQDSRETGRQVSDENSGVGGDDDGAGHAGAAGGRPEVPVSSGQQGGRRSRVAELARAKGLAR